MDSVIEAIGQKVDTAGFDIGLNSRGIIAADELSFHTSLPGVFAVGDATNRGADIAIAAIGEAGRAADVIDAYLAGVERPYRKPYVSKRVVTAEDFKDRETQPRFAVVNRPAAERRCDFRPVNSGYTAEEAMREALRCLECGCHDFHDCRLISTANDIEIHPERLAGAKHARFTETRLAVIERDQGKCITCNLCVRVCDEVVGKGILGLVGRGFETVIKPEFNDPAVIASCKDCLKCAEACPTGALKILGGI